MLLSGDECRRTQRGNNNAYCQDNPISWFDWRLVEKNADPGAIRLRADRVATGEPDAAAEGFPARRAVIDRANCPT